MKFCVLGGAGHVGSGIVRELSRNAPGTEIVVADINLEKAGRVAREVKGTPVKVDASDAEGIREAVKGSDVVLSAIGPYYRFGSEVLKAVIRAGVNFVDVDDDYDATRKCLGMTGDAEEAGITAVIGLGATPGITNILARYGADKMERVDAVNTYWAWTSLDPTIGPAIIAHYFHASDGMIPTYRGGDWVDVPALSDAEIVEFPEPLGCVEVRNVGHPEPVTIPRYIKVERVTNKGTVWPSMIAEMTKYFSMIGLTSLKKVLLGEHEIAVRDVMVKLVEHLPEIVPAETMMGVIQEVVGKYGEKFALYGVGIATRITGEAGGGKEEVFYGVTEASAVKATALPAALGAIMMAEGKIKKLGVHAPEGVVPSEEFLKRLSREMKIVEVGKKERILKF